MRKSIYLVILINLVLIFTACSGGSDSSSSPSTENVSGVEDGVGEIVTAPEQVEDKTAYFIDSPVAGLSYITQSKSGITDNDGSFEYSPTDTSITFKAGAITVGTINIVDINTDSRLFIQDLVGVSRDVVENADVLKIASFLQSLDTGANEAGITLSQVDLAKLIEEKDINDINLTRQLEFAQKILKNEDAVKEHLGDSIVANGIALYNYTPQVENSNITTFKNIAITSLFNATDKNDNILEYIVEMEVSNGTLVFMQETNSFQYTPNQDFIGSDNFSYKAFDGEKYSSIATVNIIVEDVVLIAPDDTTAPVFTSSTSISVNENQASVLTLIATDENTIIYALSGGDSGVFTLNNTTGVVTFITAPDFETKNSYSFVATATDGAGNITTQSVSVTILDVNEIILDTTAPLFTSTAIISVNENQTSAITLMASDESAVVYSISLVDSEAFTLNSATGVVRFVIAPDFETKTSYSFTAIATDEVGHISTQNITINIIDVDETVPDTTAPTFTSLATLSVNENQTSALTLVASDESVITYAISETDSQAFILNSLTGVVTFITAPDFETKASYSFVATATDGVGYITTQTVSITILDVNEIIPDTTAPLFTSPTIISVYENQTSALTLVASDESGVVYEISLADSGAFSINSITGVVTFVNAPDFETKASYSFVATATDGAGNVSTKNITINIVDIDETVPDTTAPIFTSTPTISVNENQTSALTLLATDESVITYVLSGIDSGAFRINSISGLVIFIIAPDFETKSSYSFIATATDGAGNTTTQNITINIIDIDETIQDTTAPVFTSQASISVKENQTSVLTLVATDENVIAYGLTGTDSGAFSINSFTGLVRFISVPDFETKNSYIFTATATDGVGNITTQNVNVTILDVDESVQVIVEHKGLIYVEVMSPYTGKIWLDRNLGASQACKTLDDSLCYGDYYQWGRDADGHEKSTSAISITVVADIKNAGIDFITPSSSPYDWATTDRDGALRAADWSAVDESSICPVGYRVPTITELKVETLSSEDTMSNGADAFNNFLKFPSAGLRIPETATLSHQNSTGFIWSSSVYESSSSYLYFDLNSAGTYSYQRAFGFSVRCLKD